MKKTLKIGFLLSILISSAAMAAESSPPPNMKTLGSLKGGGTWVKDNDPKVQVKLDPATIASHAQKKPSGVHVTLNRGSEVNPSTIGMTFIDANGKKLEVELKAANPLQIPTQYEDTSGASLNARAQSYIGFELKIPFGSEKPTVLKSQEFHKVVDKDMDESATSTANPK